MLAGERHSNMSTTEKSVRQEVEILIAEDSALQAQKLQYILEQQGYLVTVAVNGVSRRQLYPQAL
jgi:PleD family two-component response regulator